MSLASLVVPEVNKLDHDLSAIKILLSNLIHQQLDGTLNTTGLIWVVAPSTIGKDEDAEALIGQGGWEWESPAQPGGQSLDNDVIDEVSKFVFKGNLVPRLSTELG